MAYPNILAHRGNGTLQYLSAAELADLTELVLEKIAADGTVGCLTGVNSSDVTSIGDFTDTFRQGDLSTNDVTILETITTLYQNMNSGDVDTSTRPHPVVWDTDTNSITTIGNGHLHDLCDEILSYITTHDGPMSHKLSTDAPSGGTWVSVVTLLEKHRETLGQPYAENTVRIWKKTAGVLAHTVDCVCPEDGGLKHMTASEVSLLAEAVKARMIDTSVGSYALAENAPATGTWTNAGTIVDRRTEVNPNHNFFGSGPLTNYTGVQWLTFYGWSNAIFVGSYTSNIAQPINFITNYSGPWPVNYSTWTVPGLYNPPSQFVHYMGIEPDLVNFSGWYYGINYPSYTGYYYQTYFGPMGYSGAYPSSYTGFPTVAYVGDGVSSSVGTAQTLTLWRRIG